MEGTGREERRKEGKRRKEVKRRVRMRKKGKMQEREVHLSKDEGGEEKRSRKQ